MKLKNGQEGVSLWGEFLDTDLEKKFFDKYLSQTIKYMRPVVLMLGILYMLFIIPDYYLIENKSTFSIIFVNRILFLLMVIILFINIKRIKNCFKLAQIITAYEITATVSFIVIFSQYENPNFFIQAFGVMVIILGIFLIPNKWINMVIASLITWVVFFISSFYFIHDMNFWEFSACIIYVLIVWVMSSLFAFKMNFYNRKQYAYSLELRKQSTIDSLTNVYNRAKLNEELKNWINYSKRYEAPLAVIIFDFDNFKIINDTYGHLTGDQVMVSTVNIIKQYIRSTDILGRWGGDEFVLLLPNTARDEAIELADRLKTIISNNKLSTAGSITCSFGLAVYKNNYDEEAFISTADENLYKAKRSGKNSLVSS